MFNLEDYLEYSVDRHRFSLPLGWFAKIKYYCLRKLIRRIPFLDNIFVEDIYPNYYWQIIFYYLQKNLSVTSSWGREYFRERFIHFAAHVGLRSEDITKKVLRSGGVDVDDIEVAMSKAVGEFLERYFSAVLDVDTERRIKRITGQILLANTNLINKYHRFGDRDLELKKRNILDVEDVFECLLVQDVYTNKQVYFPYRQIYWNQVYKNSEKTLINTTTSGCAGGFTCDEAMLSAVYENIERDAFMCHWQTGTSPKKINIHNSNLEWLNNYKEKLDELGFDLYVLDTTTDIDIFSCIVVLHNKETNGVSITGGADVDVVKGIKKAINESKQMLPMFEGYHSFYKNVKFNKDGSYVNIGHTERIHRAISGKYFSDYKFLLNGESVEYKDYKFGNFSNLNISQELKFVLDIFKNKKNGYEVVYKYFFKNQHLENLGFKVVRIIQPKLYPLFLDEYFNFSDSERLRDFIMWKTGKESFTFNDKPHPFP